MIRAAEYSDLDELYLLCNEFANQVESETLPPPEEEKAKDFLVTAMDNENIILNISVVNNEIIGVICVIMSEHWFASVKVASELFWYVKPDHRGSEGLRLLKGAEKIAIDAGVNIISVAELRDGSKTKSMMGRLGYDLLETTYAKRI